MKPPVLATDKGLFHFSLPQGTLTNEEIHRSYELAMGEQQVQWIDSHDDAEQLAERAARHQASIPAEQSGPDVHAEVPALELRPGQHAPRS